MFGINNNHIYHTDKYYLLYIQIYDTMYSKPVSLLVVLYTSSVSSLVPRYESLEAMLSPLGATVVHTFLRAGHYNFGLLEE